MGALCGRLDGGQKTKPNKAPAADAQLEDGKRSDQRLGSRPGPAPKASPAPDGGRINSRAKATKGKTAKVGATARQATGRADASGVASRPSRGGGTTAPKFESYTTIVPVEEMVKVNAMVEAMREPVPEGHVLVIREKRPRGRPLTGAAKSKRAEEMREYMRTYRAKKRAEKAAGK